ncbi:MAG: ABC transporter ATP-binding protein [Deinococcales bacterium]
MALLEAIHLEKSYKVGEIITHALRGADLRVEEGEFTAIAGPSGSGKSTMLHLLAGLDKPSKGEVHLEGKRIDTLSVSKLAELRLKEFGFVFQAYNLIPVLTALENAAFVLELQGLSRSEREAKAMEALKILNIEEYAKRRPNQLSGGQQQRVAVARALAAEPKIILADEPTANLDKESSISLIEHMKALNEDKGVTFLFSTHDPRLLDYVERIIWMEDGRVIHDERKQAKAA